MFICPATNLINLMQNQIINLINKNAALERQLEIERSKKMKGGIPTFGRMPFSQN